MVVYDRHPGKLRALKRQHRIIAEPDLERAVRRASLLVVAVRPSSVAHLLREIGRVDRPLVAISLAAGVPLRTLQGQAGKSVQWARAMPSPACRTRRGLTAITFARGLPAEAREEVRKLFARVGAVAEIPESHRHLFHEPRISCPGYSGRSRGENRTGPQKRMDRCCPRLGGRDSVVARRQALGQRTGTRGGYAGRSRGDGNGGDG